MRRAALLLSMLLAGTAQAVPANPTDVEHLMQELGLASNASGLNDVVTAAVVELKAMPGSSLQSAEQESCVHSVLLKGTMDGIRDNIVSGLGEDGSVVLAEWMTFLASPMGLAMSAKAAGASEEDAAAMITAMDPAELEKAKAFMASGNAERLISSMGIQSVDGALIEQVVGRLEDACHVHIPENERS